MKIIHFNWWKIIAIHISHLTMKNFVFIGAMSIISTSGYIPERSKMQTQIAQNSKVLFQRVKMYSQLMLLYWAQSQEVQSTGEWMPLMNLAKLVREMCGSLELKNKDIKRIKHTMLWVQFKYYTIRKTFL